MPVRRALPDVIFDQWSDFALWRSSKLAMQVPFPLIVTISLLSFCLYYTYECFSVCNIRKYAFLLCLAFFFRCLVLFVTQLPPPCHGFPNCPCAHLSYAELRQKYPLWVIAVIYFVTFGFGSRSIPACGCVLMSGHVTLQTVLALYLTDTMKLIVSQDKVSAAKFTAYVLIGLSSLYSILMRSDYTVGVVLSVIFVLLEAWLYQIAQTMCDFVYGPFVTTQWGRFFLWMEREFEEPHAEAGTEVDRQRTV
jgi:hypothetical protein